MNIINTVRPKAKAIGRGDSFDECWKFFIDMVRKNLHVTLCFSRSGMSSGRARDGSGPGQLHHNPIGSSPGPKKPSATWPPNSWPSWEMGEEQTRQSVIDFMPFSFEIANQAARKCFDIERRYVYTTPKSFLELLSLFKIMLE